MEVHVPGLMPARRGCVGGGGWGCVSGLLRLANKLWSGKNFCWCNINFSSLYTVGEYLILPFLSLLYIYIYTYRKLDVEGTPGSPIYASK